MKNFLIFSVLIFLCSCSDEIDITSEHDIKLSSRTLPTYMIPYQYSSGNILTKTSSNLTSWSSGYTASSTSSKYGTTSTIYNYMVTDTARKYLVLFQNSSEDIYFVEYKDGGIAWSSPAAVSSANSPLLPSVELSDGIVIETHVISGSPSYVFESLKSGSWTSPVQTWEIFGSTDSTEIISDYSPTFEYHNQAAVTYLVTANIDEEFSGYGLPELYWRYTGHKFTPTSTPSIVLGHANIGELNASLTPVALTDNNNRPKLYLFFTEPGTSTNTENKIRFFIGSVTSITNGTISSWTGPYEIEESAYTSSKIDGVFIDDSDRLVITYRNHNTGAIDLAYSDDFGSNWDLISGVAASTGAPSIVNLE